MSVVRTTRYARRSLDGAAAAVGVAAAALRAAPVLSAIAAIIAAALVIAVLNHLLNLEDRR